MPTKTQVAARARKLGRQNADRVLRARQKELKVRAAAAARAARLPARRTAVARPLPARFLKLAGPRPTSGVLIAEGDSWFDYPFNDVLKQLEDKHLFDVESVAHKGDRVEHMAFSGGQLEAFCRRIEKVIRRGDTPRAILLSGGGNDIAGDEFAMLLNHAASPIGGLNEDVVRGVVDSRIRVAYITIISEVTRVCEVLIGRRLPIILHGYDYPVPDGRGFFGGWGPLPGPWLKPGFDDKGFANLNANTKLMRTLMTRFNTMLNGLVQLSDFSHVRYVDLRETLSSGSDYRRFWDNELHPTARGFALVAAKLAAAVERGNA